MMIITDQTQLRALHNALRQQIAGYQSQLRMMEMHPPLLNRDDYQYICDSLDTLEPVYEELGNELNG